MRSMTSTTMERQPSEADEGHALMSVREMTGDLYPRLTRRQKIWAAMIAEAVLFGVLEDLDELCEQGTAFEVGEEAGRRLLAVRRG